MSGQTSDPSPGRLGRVRDNVLFASPGLLVALYVFTSRSATGPLFGRLFDAAFVGFGVQFVGFAAYLFSAGFLGHFKGNDGGQSMDAAKPYWLPAAMSVAIIWVWLSVGRHRDFDSLVECVRESQESYEVAVDALELGQPERPRELTRRFSEVVRDCPSYWNVDDDDY